jgi:hypothetical protein
MAGEDQKPPMNFLVIPAALLMALVLTLLFMMLYNARGQWSDLFFFFIIVFLGTWSGQLWITPRGTETGTNAIAWLPLIMVSLVFAFLVMALMPPGSIRPAENPGKDATDREKMFGLGIFFWIFFGLILLSILIGYLRV